MKPNSAPPTPLQAVAGLFEKFNEQGIRYCHWKSTHGIPYAMSGQTDLDILVDRSHSQRFKEILYQLDFKPFVSDPRRQFPAIEDYLGFDQTTGHLIHLHIHYRLVLGEQYVKNYYLPLEQSFLDKARLRPDLGVKVPAPELEIIVLVLRALLKYRDQDVLRDILRLGRSARIPVHILDEFKDLLTQTTLENIACALNKHVDFVSPDLVFKFLNTIQDAPRSGWTLYQLRRQVRRELAPFQRYSRLRAQIMYYRVMLTVQWPFDRLFQRIWPKHNKRKIPVSGGLRVAFIGADGAGKSTTIKHIVKWLSWRLNVRTYYMGNTQPSATTKFLKSISKWAQFFYGGCRRLFGEKSSLTRQANGLQRFFTSVRILGDGHDRYHRYLASQRKAAQGSVIIYDRYPLEAVRLFDRTMDGPRIATTYNGQRGPLVKKLCQAEENLYRQIRPPEHLFILRVSPEVSLARKPDHKLELIEAKSRAIAQIVRDDLSFTEIDAEQPLEQVLLQIKSTLWRLL
jgi:thymidylate kinase